MNDIVRKKRKRLILVSLTVIVSIVILCIIFGTVDYILSVNGKKPIFTYNTVNISSFDVTVLGFEDTTLSPKEGATYYGLGYSISICDKDTGNYVFQLGHNQDKPCITSLTCTETDDLNIKRSYEYSFFDGKLYLVSEDFQIPIENTDESEDELEEWSLKLNDVRGCGATFKKLNETTYEIVKICNISKMAAGDIEEVYTAGYKSIIDTRTTKKDITDYYYKWMVCE